MTVRNLEPLSRHTFLNPAFKEDWQSERYRKEHPTSHMAHLAHSLVSSAWMAFENENSGIPMDQRGISQSLETARAIIGDLIDQAEDLEQKMRQLRSGEAA